MPTISKAQSVVLVVAGVVLLLWAVNETDAVWPNKWLELILVILAVVCFFVAATSKKDVK